MSRPFIWMFCRSSPVTVLRRALSATCTGVTLDVTVSVSVSAPTCSVTLPRSRISALDSAMSAIDTGLKLVSSTLTTYRPGSRPAIRNNPFSLETTVRTAVVAASVAVTVAPGTADPELSTTVPVKVPVVPCASAGEAPTRQTNATTNGTAHTRRTLFISDSFRPRVPHDGKSRAPYHEKTSRASGLQALRLRAQGL